VLTQLKSTIVKMCHVLTEYRSAPRRSFDTALSISWSDTRGRIVHGAARGLDISDSGARIEYNQPVAKLTPIRISAHEGRLVKTGKVCYCDPAGSAYHVGIQFS
jgi:PilZ domain-containing protein